VPPEVLAWALAFVIAVGLLCRFFAWLGHRGRAKRWADDEGTRAPANEHVLSPIAPSAAPKAESAVRQTGPDTPRTAAPLLQVPKPAPARDFAPVGKLPSTEADAPSASATAAAHSAPAPEATNNQSADMAAGAAAEVVRTALAPSVAATIAPRELQKPSVAATLPPAPPAQVLSPEPAHIPEAPGTPEDLPAEAPTVLEVAAPVPPPEAAAVPEAAEPLAPREIAFPPEEPVRISPVGLRARRMGVEAVRLNDRLRDTREWRIRRMPKAIRGPGKLAASRALRVLGPKAARMKIPARRIVRQADALMALASINRRTKIVGVRPRGFRVLSSSSA
jgi:hypothetical protein